MRCARRSSVFFRLAYLVGFTPWDSGVTPPELVEVVEGEGRLPPGRALDLGCGTGTNSVYLARHGWEVTGIDLVPRAIAAARRRAAAVGVAPRLLHGDVSRLDRLDVAPGQRLVFDLGCYHTLPEDIRDAYVRGVTELAAPGATLLLFGFAPGAARFLPGGVSAAELERRFSGWRLGQASRGTDRVETWWYRLTRAGGPSQVSGREVEGDRGPAQPP